MSKREYRRFTAEQKLEILREAEQPGVTVSEVCRRHALSPSVLYRWRAVAQSGSTVALGVPRSVYYAWKSRESLEDKTGTRCRLHELLPEERVAICQFALAFPKIGYRKLTWMMVDATVACVGESTVYRVLSEADLLSRWKRSAASSGEYHFRPTGPNQQWHTDIMYVWVLARFYFLVSFVDAYSRYVVHHKLLIELDGRSVATELEAALESVEGATPRIVHDHGSEFVNRDVSAVVKAHNLIEIKTRPRHPESNGIVERFNGTVRQESDDDYGANYLKAEATIAELMRHYNEERLHAALGYMTPATWHRGKPDEVRDERARRIAAARAHRKLINQHELFSYFSDSRRVSNPEARQMSLRQPLLYRGRQQVACAAITRSKCAHQPLAEGTLMTAASYPNHQLSPTGC